MFTKVTSYSDYFEGGEPVDITDTGFSPAKKVWSQMPPETASEVKNFKVFLGEHAHPQNPLLNENYNIIPC